MKSMNKFFLTIYSFCNEHTANENYFQLNWGLFTAALEMVIGRFTQYEIDQTLIIIVIDELVQLW